jgi:hypothetical protein
MWKTEVLKTNTIIKNKVARSAPPRRARPKRSVAVGLCPSKKTKALRKGHELLLLPL